MHASRCRAHRTSAYTLGGKQVNMRNYRLPAVLWAGLMLGVMLVVILAAMVLATVGVLSASAVGPFASPAAGASAVVSGELK